MHADIKVYGCLQSRKIPRNDVKILQSTNTIIISLIVVL